MYNKTRKMNKGLTLPNNFDRLQQFLNKEEIAAIANVTRHTVYNVFNRRSANQAVIAAVLRKVEEMKEAVAQIGGN